MPTTLRWVDKDNALIREALAAYAHDAWSGWMKYMLPKLQLAHQQPDGKWELTHLGVMTTHFVAPGFDESFLYRWIRQAMTSYADLPEEEKESNRREAEKMLEVFRQVGATLTVTYEPIKLDGDFDGKSR
jgi:hypothetical protein